MKLCFFPATALEHQNGLDGFRLIAENPGRIVDFSAIEKGLTLADLSGTYDHWQNFVRYDNKTYAIHKKYTDLDEDRWIVLGYEVLMTSEVYPPEEVEENDKYTSTT